MYVYMYVCMDGWMNGGIYVCIHFTKYLSRNTNVLGLELDSLDIMRSKRHILYPSPSDLVTRTTVINNFKCSEY